MDNKDYFAETIAWMAITGFFTTGTFYNLNNTIVNPKTSNIIATAACALAAAFTAYEAYKNISNRPKFLKRQR